MFSPSAFYSALRKDLGPFSPQQVNGIDLILKEGARRKTPNNHMADIFATTWWETGKTMQPVKEAFFLGSTAEAWRKKHLRYYPYYGRGYVQLTWEYNYRKVTDYFNQVLGIKVDFVRNPDLVMNVDYAVIILFEGMKQGWFTSKKLSDYIDDQDESDAEDLREFVAARKIINGTDKAETIGKIALLFEHALRAGKWDESTVVPITPKPTKPVQPEPVAPRGLIAFFIELLISIFRKKGK